MMLTAAVITCSDRAVADATEGRAGSVLREGLEHLGCRVTYSTVVALDPAVIRDAVVEALNSGVRVVFTVGSSGLLPRDCAVEATAPLLDYTVPGIMEEVRRRGAEKTELALLSRGVAGVVAVGRTKPALVLNAPGSRGGVRDTLSVLAPMLSRIIDSLDGVDHDLSRPPSDGSNPQTDPQS